MKKVRLIPIDKFEKEVILSFDDHSVKFGKKVDENLVFLSTTIRYLNDMLKARGKVYLNEVCDEFGLARTSRGQIYGWKHSNGNGIHVEILDIALDRILFKLVTDGVIL